MTIGIGVFWGGSGAPRSAAGGVVETIRDVLRRETSALPGAEINLVFDFTATRSGLGRPKLLREHNAVRVDIRVPESLWRSPEPEVELMASIRAALLLAFETLDYERIEYPREGYSAALGKAEAALAEGPRSVPAVALMTREKRFIDRSSRGRGGRRHNRRGCGEAMRYEEPELQFVEVRFEIDSERALKQVYRLEGLLGRVVEEAGVGELDGNEIGEGLYVIFISTEEPSAAEDLLRRFLDEASRSEELPPYRLLAPPSEPNDERGDEA